MTKIKRAATEFEYRSKNTNDKIRWIFNPNSKNKTKTKKGKPKQNLSHISKSLRRREKSSRSPPSTLNFHDTYLPYHQLCLISFSSLFLSSPHPTPPHLLTSPTLIPPSPSLTIPSHPIPSIRATSSFYALREKKVGVREWVRGWKTRGGLED